MSLIQKITLWVVTLIGVVILFNLGLTFFVNRQLPRIIAEKNQTPYKITYKSLDIDLLSRSIKAEGIAIIPKSKDKVGKEKLGIYSKINSVEINQFSIWDMLFNDRIKANSITINTPEVLLYKQTKNAINNRESLSSAVVKPFQQIIVVSEINLKKGTIKIIHTQTMKPVLSVKNMHLKVNGIVLNEKSLKKTIPFIYEDYIFEGDSIYYRANDFYHIKAKNIKTTNKNLTVNKFELIPEYTRKEFVRILDKEKDLFTIQSESIAIESMDWGFKDTIPFFNANKVVFKKLAANIYRNKIPTDDLSKKPLYSKLLRDINFPMKIDTLAINNSQLVYEEEINFVKGPGMLTFDAFNLQATNIQSGYKQTKLDDVAITINCKFMNNSAFKVKWNFNILDKQERFTFNGKITNLKTSDLSRFTKPYINATTKGIFDSLEFTIKGNDYNSYETAALKYHNLKVTLYQKNDRQKESKIKSALANLIVKNDTNGKTNTTTVKVERVPEKSFFNFLWLNVAGILKQIVI